MILRGPRLTLRALTADEVEALRWDPSEVDAQVFFATQLRADPDARGWWIWGATLAGGDDVGSGGFGGRPAEDGRLTVGYGIHPEHRGRGYATELLDLLATWGLAQPGIESIRATIRPDNVASMRVAEKAGFRPTGERLQDEEHGELLVFERHRESGVTPPGRGRAGRA